MMIKSLISFGIFMLAENTVTLALLLDLIWRITVKIIAIRHPHLFWKSGMIFLAFLLCMLLINIAEFYLCWVNYLERDKPIDFWTVVVRVSIRSLMCLATILLWYYSIRGGFNLFKDKNNHEH